MPTIQLVVSEEDHRRFTYQAGHDGKRLEDWLIFLARQRVVEPAPDGEIKTFQSREELNEFWKWCDSLRDLEREPDWEEHLRNIDASMRDGLPDV